jgi:tRNA(fMet)-specific endonuclease VapC
MDAIVVDTDIVSFFFRRDSRATLYQPHLAGKLVMISFMTVAELDRWTLTRRWGARRRAELEQHLADLIIRHSTRALCRMWAEVTDGARRRGHPISVPDAWHAATALVEDVPLVTHNRRDFAGVLGLRLISEAP